MPYGYRRLPRDSAGPARLEIYEPEADVVRRIFHRHRGRAGLLHPGNLPATGRRPDLTPSGRRRSRGTSTISRLLRNESPAWISTARDGSLRREIYPSGVVRGRPTSGSPIPVPPIIDEQTFTAASKAMMDNTQNGARGALNPVNGYSKALSGAGVAVSMRLPDARPQRSCTVTTTAATTT